MTRALIADDEPLLRAQLRARLAALWPELEITVEAENGMQAVAAFENGTGPEVCFLDIHMPGLSGMEAARRIQVLTEKQARIVFLTAFEQHAVDAFEQGAVDYVLKPFDDARLEETLRRLRAPATPGPDLDALLERLSGALLPAGGTPARRLHWIKASVGNTVRLIPVEDIQYFHADDKYTRVVMADGEVLIRKPIKELVAELDAEHFWQIHRATIVNTRAIAGVVRGLKDTADLKLRGRPETLTVSRAYLHLFKQM